MISRLAELGIDPRTKTFVWSDCLDIDMIEKLAERFDGGVKVAFGVGTNLAHDIPGLKPLSIVMKMTYSNGQPVLKLSDDPGKGMCPDPSLVEYAKKVYGYKQLV
jgi:nicotinate phosphoribosyltransferase